MSRTTIYGLIKNGEDKDWTKWACESIGDVRNAWRSAMCTWRYFIDKYKPTGMTGFIFEDINLVWDVEMFKKYTLDEQWLMVSTYDRQVFDKEAVQRLIKVFRCMQPIIEKQNGPDVLSPSLMEQADILEHALSVKPEIDLYCFSQTSVADIWGGFPDVESGHKGLFLNAGSEGPGKCANLPHPMGVEA